MATDPTSKIGADLLMAALPNMEKIEDPNVEWTALYKEFEKIEELPNQIDYQYFMDKYGILYDARLLKENITQYSAKAKELGLLSDELLKEINPYRPIELVENGKVIKTLAPIFRQVDLLNNAAKMMKKGEDKDPSLMLTNVVNNVFDKYSSHQLKAKRQEGAVILNQCMLSVQDRDKIRQDIDATTEIIKKFHSKENTDESVQDENIVQDNTTTPTEEDTDDLFIFKDV